MAKKKQTNVKRAVRSSPAGVLSDITARKRAEELLRESEARYRLLAESATDVIWTVALNMQMTYVSPSVTRLLGFTVEEAMARTMQEAYTLTTFEKVMQAFVEEMALERAGRGDPKRSRMLELELIRKDGGTVPVEANFGFLRDATGKPTGILTIARDITARKRAEEALRESEGRFRLLYEKAPLGYQSLDAAGCFIDVNQAWLDTLGYSREEVLGRWFGDFLAPREVEPFKQRFPKFKATGEIHVEVEMVRKDGAHAIIAIVGRIGYDEHGGFKQTHCILTDITARQRAEESLRESEKRYWQLVEHAPAGIFEVDLIHSRFLSVNGVMCEYTGYTQGELLALSPPDILTEDSRQSFLQELARIAAGEPVPPTVEYQIRGKNGREFWVLLNAQYFYRVGIPVRATVVIHDITERKRAHESLRESESKFRSFVEQSAEGYVLTDEQGVVIEWNQALVEMTGVKREEALGQFLWAIQLRFSEDEHKTPESEERTKTAMLQMLQTGQMPKSPVEYNYRRPDGALGVAQQTLFAIKTAKGFRVGSTARDITEHKRAEDALRESERKVSEALEFNRKILDTSSIGILTYKKSGQCVSANAAAAKVVGATAAQLLAQNFHEIPSWKKYGMYEAATRALDTGIEEVVEVHLVTTFGKDLWSSFGFSSFDSAGERHLLVFTSDITERKRAEEALHQSEEKYRMLIENVGEGIGFTNLEEQFSFANPAAEEIFGVLPSRLPGRNLREFFMPEQFAVIQEQTRRRRVGEKSVYETEISRPDGAKRDLLVTATPQFDSQGKFVGTFGVFRDITEHKRAEDARRESERALVEAQGVAHLGNWSWNRDTGAQQWSREMFNIYDILPSQVAPSHEDIMARVHEDDLPEYLSRFEKALRSGNAYELDHRLVTPTRGDVWVHIRVKPRLDETGQVTGLFGTASDITERKRAEATLRQAEEHYRSIFENAAEGIYQSSPLGCFTRVNSALARMLGYESPDAVIKSITSIPDQFYADSDHRSIFMQQLERKGTLENFVSECLRKDGSRIWISENVRAVRDADGTLLYYEGFIQDITERKRVEQEREGLLQEVLRARTQLQTLSRQSLAAQENERREIARELHDEIGQVLTAVKTNLQLIQLAPDPATLKPRLEESNQIVDQALDRIRTLALDLRPSLLDDFGLVTALEWYLERQGRRAGFTIEFSAEPHEMRLPETLESTCFRLVQAALTNVERHARAAQVQVLLRQTQVPRAVELSVRDNGIGFDVPAALARAAHGESLGLIGMQERARLAGGSLAIESAPGHGTEIRVQFPVKDDG